MKKVLEGDSGGRNDEAGTSPVGGDCGVKNSFRRCDEMTQKEGRQRGLWDHGNEDGGSASDRNGDGGGASDMGTAAAPGKRTGMAAAQGERTVKLGFRLLYIRGET